MKENEFILENAKPLFLERGKKVVELFGEKILSNINNDEIIKILYQVKGYWKDNFRSALTSFCCEAVGGNPEDTIPASLIITLTGAGIGIHDDIIDQSEIKPNRKTIPFLYGSKEALVIGDLLIFKGLTEIQGILEKNYNPEKTLQIFKTLQLFLIELCQGVFIEKNCRKKIHIPLKYYDQVLWKFGADIEACAQIGGIIGGGNENEISSLADYGKRLGYIFRIAEDLRDIKIECFEDAENLVRRLEYESIPLPILLAAKKSSKNDFKIMESIFRRKINKIDALKLVSIYNKTQAIDSIREIVKKNVEDGIQSLNILRKNKIKDILISKLENMCCDLI